MPAKIPYPNTRTIAEVKAEARDAPDSEQPATTMYLFIENGVEVGYADVYPVLLPELEPNVLVQETGEPPSPFQPPPPGWVPS